MDPKSLRERSQELMEERQVLTETLTQLPIPQLRELCQTLSWLGDMTTLHRQLTEWYRVRMVDSRLEYNLILASYGAEHYQECFALCRGYLTCHDSIPIYILAIKVCLNHLQLPQFALHFAKLGLEKFSKNADIALGEAVALSMMGDRSVYDTERRSYWSMAEEILQGLKTAKRDSTWHLACVKGQLGKFVEAYATLLPCLLHTKELKCFALAALLKQAAEDYKAALHTIRRGLMLHPSSLLLLGVRVSVKVAMHREGILDGFEVSQSVVDFMKVVSQEGLEGSLHSHKPVQIAGLASIREETSNQMESLQDGLESVKLMKLDTNTQTVQQALAIAFEACCQINEWGMAQWFADRIKSTTLPKAVRSR